MPRKKRKRETPYEQLARYAYVAGFLDTDGSISISVADLVTGPNYYAALTFSGMYREPLEYILLWWRGPNITSSESTKPQGGAAAMMYYLTYNGAKAVPVVRAIRPYVRVKTVQADSLMALDRTRDRKKRARLALAILEANFKGKTSRPSKTLQKVRFHLSKEGIYGR